MARLKVKPYKTKTEIADEVIKARKEGEDANKIGLGKWDPGVQAKRGKLSRALRKVRKGKEGKDEGWKEHVDKKAKQLRDHPEDFEGGVDTFMTHKERAPLHKDDPQKYTPYLKKRVTRHYKAGGLAKRGYGIAKRKR